MKRLSKYFIFIFIFFLISSCSKNELIRDNSNIYAIKSEVSDGQIISSYNYNNLEKIAEREGFHFYNRYTYDEAGRLIKRESAMDMSLLSSSIIKNPTFMTAQNTVITSQSFFEYDYNGNLIEINNYFEEEGTFIKRSSFSFEYDGDLIIRRNLFNEEGFITQFKTFEYDNNRNVKTKKHYSFLFTNSSEPKLISESSYEYDDKNNPFIIFKAIGNPGLFSNTNNIVETNSISYIDTPGISNYSTSKTIYEYNKKNYPVKVLSENSVYEYRY